MAAPTRLPRLAWIATGALAVALAGCSPITTQVPYAASDGVQAQVGDQVKAENLLIVTAAEGEPGVLLGGLTNLGDEATAVTVTIGAQSVDIPLEPSQTALLGATEATESDSLTVQDVAIDAVAAAPGDVTDISLSTPRAGSVTVAVPVLDGTLEQYAALVPTAEPTVVAVPTASATPRATPTATP